MQGSLSFRDTQNDRLLREGGGGTLCSQRHLSRSPGGQLRSSSADARWPQTPDLRLGNADHRGVPRQTDN